MLRNAPLLLVATAGLAACVTPTPTTAISLETRLQRHIAAIQSRDLAGIEATITKGADLLLILPSGKLSTTRADYMSFHQGLFADPDWVMTFDPLHIQRLGDYGHALYRVTFDGDGAGPAPASPAYLSLGFQLQEGEWRVVHDQNTPIASPP